MAAVKEPADGGGRKTIGPGAGAGEIGLVGAKTEE